MNDIDGAGRGTSADHGSVSDRAAPDWLQLIRFPHKIDARGCLVIGELSGVVPFECRRFFMVHDVPVGVVRGAHAHHECHQLLIAMTGRVGVHVDDGFNRADIVLESPDIGLYLPPLTWASQYDHSPDCALLVLASHPYEADDYIHDLDAFLALKGGRR